MVKIQVRVFSDMNIMVIIVIFLGMMPGQQYGGNPNQQWYGQNQNPQAGYGYAPMPGIHLKLLEFILAVFILFISSESI